MIFGAHRSEVTLFWGGFGCNNKKLSSRIILEELGAAICYFVIAQKEPNNLGHYILFLLFVLQFLMLN